MADTPRETVKLPNRYHVDAALVGIGHEAVQFRPPILRTGDSGVNVLPRDSPAAPLAIVAKLARLHGNVLAVICSADSRVDCRAVYSVGSHVAPPLCNWVRACRLLEQTAGPLSSLSLFLWLATSAFAVSARFRLRQESY